MRPDVTYAMYANVGSACLHAWSKIHREKRGEGRRSRGPVRKKQTKQEGGQREQEKKGDQGRNPPDQVNNHLKMGDLSLL